MKVLIIDNNPEERQQFHEVITSTFPGMKCLQASDGEQGVKIMIDEPDVMPDYIFVDIDIPNNGLNCLREIRRVATKNVPVFLYTSSNAGELKNLMLNFCESDQIASNLVN